MGEEGEYKGEDREDEDEEDDEPASFFDDSTSPLLPNSLKRDRVMYISITMYIYNVMYNICEQYG